MIDDEEEFLQLLKLCELSFIRKVHMLGNAFIYLFFFSYPISSREVKGIISACNIQVDV